MKHLVIGIDGGTLEIFKHFEMPFLHALIGNASILTAHEDVWSRGWAEMYTGQHALETKAFYELPALDGTHRFLRTYKWKEAQENPHVKFLWDVLDRGGVSSLFMNIPTTFPSPELEKGVFVSGAGGGLSSLRKIVDGLCSQNEIRERLEQQGYMVDLRYDTSGIKDIKVLFEQLNKMAKTRSRCFVDLSKSQRSEFGFLVFRATTIVQYLAMVEIQHLLDGGKNIRPIHQMIKEHYKVLDEALAHIFESLSPESFILTADHATVPFKKRSNLNPFLSEAGYQPQRRLGMSAKRILVQSLPKGLFTWIRNNTPNSLKDVSRSFDVVTSKAFAQENIHGIYINDQRRFNGPVKEAEELDSLVDEICSKFNQHPTVKENGMNAVPYRRFHENAFFSDYAPDIFVERPETLFFDGQGRFVENNAYYVPILSLDNIPRDVNSGQKGSRPLFVMSRNLDQFISDSSPIDLTEVYRLTCRRFGL